MAKGNIRSHSYLVPFKKKSGDVLWVEVHTNAVEYKGQVAELALCRDITDRKNIEDKFRESKERYSSIVEGANDGIVIISKDRKIVFANKRVASLLGYTVEETFELDLLKVICPSSLKEAVKLFKSRMAGEDVVSTYTIEVFHKEGYPVPVEMSIAKIDYNGEPADIVFARDITERKLGEQRLKEIRGSYHTLIESSPDIIAQFDENGKILTANTNMLEFLGLLLDDVLNAKITDIIPEKISNEILEVLENNVLKDQTESFEENIGGKYYRILIVPINTSDKKRSFQIIARDITKQKNAELKSNKLLEDLGRSNKELEQFAYVASHDLQEPLRMVSSYLTLLSRRYKGKLDSDADEFIEFAVDGAKRMQDMINALLTYSRVGTRGRPFEQTNCESVINSVISNLEVRIKESGAVVTHDPLPTVMADDVQFIQLLQNLISNAIKYNDKKKPTVHVSAEKKGIEWLFSLKDNGIGIDPEYKDKVFEIFRRLQTKNEYEGSGIGLSVCKKIVERHGGRIWLESKPSEGTTFYFTVPMKGIKNDG